MSVRATPRGQISSTDNVGPWSVAIRDQGIKTDSRTRVVVKNLLKLKCQLMTLQPTAIVGLIWKVILGSHCHHMWKEKSLSLPIKLRLFEVFVLPVLLCVVETLLATDVKLRSGMKRNMADFLDIPNVTGRSRLCSRYRLSFVVVVVVVTWRAHCCRTTWWWLVNGREWTDGSWRLTYCRTSWYY